MTYENIKKHLKTGKIVKSVVCCLRTETWLDSFFKLKYSKEKKLCFFSVIYRLMLRSNFYLNTVSYRSAI